MSIIGRSLGFMTGGVALPGGHLYDTPGTYSWICPANVFSVCAVSIAPGCVGIVAGSLRYKNNIPVVPGNSYAVVVRGAEFAGNNYFIDTSTVCASSGGVGTNVGDGGGNGGGCASAGGGAGGYSGNGGSANGAIANGSPGSGGGGGAGGNYDDGTDAGGGGGGGVSVYGQGSSGAGGTGTNGGGGGSGGTSGGNGSSTSGAQGGSYGGAGGQGTATGAFSSTGGAVRIIWGAGRSFPSTNVGQNYGGVTEGHN